MEHKQEPKIEDASDRKPRNRSRRQRRNGGEHSSHAHAPAPQAFRGAHKDLQGQVYTYDTIARAYQYAKTTEKISEWAAQNFQFSEDIEDAIEDLAAPEESEWAPSKNPAKEGEDKGLKDKIENEKVKEYMLRLRTYKDNKRTLFSIILGQCDDALKAKLDGQPDWATIRKEKDFVELL